MCASIAAPFWSIVRTTRAGLPMTSELSGNSLFSVTTLPAPMMQFLPIFAPFSTTAWMPISAPSPTVQPCNMAWCPTDTLAPITSGTPKSACSTERSWMLLLAPMRIASQSPRTTQPGHTLAFSPSSTLPITSALSATQAPGPSFGATPPRFYLDWTRVAAEEAYHFTLLREHLSSLGHSYGDFAAHDNLWAMCEKTSGDIVARMALVPRTLEARGLDATPQIQEKLRQAGTPAARRAVDILDVIVRDEIGHVAVGNYWYRWLCEREALDPIAHYPVLIER